MIIEALLITPLVGGCIYWIRAKDIVKSEIAGKFTGTWALGLASLIIGYLLVKTMNYGGPRLDDTVPLMIGYAMFIAGMMVMAWGVAATLSKVSRGKISREIYRDR